MAMVSHLHQLFNAEQCQAYIHTLRWNDRPLQLKCFLKSFVEPTRF